MKKLTSPKTRLFFDMHYPEWPEKHVATRLNPQHLAEAFIDSGAESIILYAKCQYGNAYYNTNIGHKHIALKDIDFVKEMTELLHKENRQVIAYYSVVWDEFQATKHPQWLTVDEVGSTESTEFRWKTLCINSPYREFVKAQLLEIAQMIPIDGFWIDMTIIGKGRCHCDFCKAAYERKYPSGLSFADFSKDKLQFNEFRFDYVESFYNEIYSAIREVRPNLVLMNNYWGYPYSPASMGSRTVGAQREADVITGEAYTDWTGLEAPEFFSRFLRGVANMRPFEALISRFTNTWDFTRKPSDQLNFECMSVFSHGGTITLDDQPYYDGSIDTQLYREELKTIFSRIHTFQYTVDGERERCVAIFHSQKTKQSISQQAFIKDIIGAYKIFRDNHMPVDFIFDDDLHFRDLSVFQAICLPAVSSLSEENAIQLHSYLEKGGIIIAFGENALLRHLGSDTIKDGGFSDSSISYIYTDAPNPEYLLVRGAYRRYTDSTQLSNAYVIDPIVETSKHEFYHNNLPAPFSTSEVPVFFPVEVGKGTLIQFTQPLASSYAKQPSIGIRRLIHRVLLEYNVHQNTQVTAPVRVAHEVYHQRTEKRVFIHLIVRGNESSLSVGLWDTMTGNFERPYVFMEEAERALGITVKINVPGQISQITSLNEKNNVSWRQKGETLLIDIEGVTLWDVIEVTYV